MREVDQHAEALAFLDHLQRDVRQALEARCLGLQIAEWRLDEVHQLQMAQAHRTHERHALGLALQEVRGLRCHDDVRLAAKRGVDVRCGECLGQVPLARCVVVSCDAPLEITPELSRFGLSNLLDAFGGRSSERSVVDQGPGDERAPASSISLRRFRTGSRPNMAAWECMSAMNWRCGCWARVRCRGNAVAKAQRARLRRRGEKQRASMSGRWDKRPATIWRTWR
ncbi:hypothetical protein E5CHR_04646 [Variovorax sp. PBL-E5]|nr:hypothetical protein E5CHR_04646 [Variovorax sp. PBL-E5]